MAIQNSRVVQFAKQGLAEFDPKTEKYIYTVDLNRPTEVQHLMLCATPIPTKGSDFKARLLAVTDRNQELPSGEILISGPSGFMNYVFQTDPLTTRIIKVKIELDDYNLIFARSWCCVFLNAGETQETVFKGKVSIDNSPLEEVKIHELFKPLPLFGFRGEVNELMQQKLHSTNIRLFFDEDGFFDVAVSSTSDTLIISLPVHLGKLEKRVTGFCLHSKTEVGEIDLHLYIRY